MGAATAQQHVPEKPLLMFIDDEPRVLKSMRAMFRKDYEVYLANSGHEALQIMADKPIQVVVSDQRMPKMTGVEVLTQIKHSYPNVVRILLTGYADLEAIEASLNDAEVFRYLMKPCPAEEVREAVQSGLELTSPKHTAEVITLALPGDSERTSHNQPRLETKHEELETTGGAEEQAEPSVTAPARSNQPTQATATPQPGTPTVATSMGSQANGHIVLLGNSELKTALKTAAPKAKISSVENVSEALELNVKQPIAVLIADVPTDEMINITEQISRQLPHTVNLTVSDKSDASLLINLINAGQAFRFLVKPVQSGRLKLTLNSAFERYALSAPKTQQAKSTWQRMISWLLGQS